jgi:sirohydrochlorin ferrochelatase
MVPYMADVKTQTRSNSMHCSRLESSRSFSAHENFIMTSSPAHLVLSAHGSPRSTWRDPLDGLQAALDDDDTLTSRYPGGVQIAFLDHDQPLLVPLVRDAIANGFTVDVLPVFLSRGRHQEVDLPRLLGLTTSSGSDEDGLPPGEPVRLLPPVEWSAVLASSVVRRARERIPAPGSASALLVHYGSTLQPCPWSALAARLGDALTAAGFAQTAHMGAGHHRPDPATEIAAVVTSLLDESAFVVIVALLLAKGSIQEEVIPQAIRKLDPALQERLGWIPDAVLPDVEVHAAIAAHALKAASGA